MTYASAIATRFGPRFSLSADRISQKIWPSPESSGIRDLQHEDSTIRSIQTRRPARWLASALQRLRELADLEPGWDEAAAKSIPPSLISSVRDFLTSDLMSKLEIEPDIVPTLEGKLLIEWHTKVVDLIIEAGSDGNPSFYFFNNETGEEVEAPLGQRLDALRTAFASLATAE